MAGPYHIEIQRSPGDLGESSYQTVATLTNGGAGFAVGDPFEFVDTPLTGIVPGQLYYYRARYIPSDGNGCSSDWGYAVARPPYPTGKATSMGCVITAAQAQTGVGRERTYGRMVQATHGLDVLNHSFPPPKAVAESQANRGVPSAVSDEVDAAVNPAGSFSVDLRPNGGVPRLLLAGYKIESTTVVPAVVGPPAVPEHYVHKLVPAFTDSPVSLHLKEGPYSVGVGGFTVGSLGIESDKQAQNPIRASVAGNYLDYALFDADTNAQLAALGLAALAYDSNKYGPTDWYLALNGVQSPDCRRFAHSYNRNLGEKQVGNLHTGPNCHYVDKNAVGGTADLYFADLALVKQYLGQAGGAVPPFGVKKAILTGEVRWVIQPPAAANGVVYKVEVVYPVASVRSLTNDLPESGPVMLPVAWQPRQDQANGFIDHYILWTTTETAAALATPSPEVGHKPKTDLYPYSAVQGIASGVPTTTSIVSAVPVAPFPALAASDDAYNGLSLLFTTGVLAGESRAITDYVAATRTFTTAAFGTAPAAGDKFIVVNGWGL